MRYLCLLLLLLLSTFAYAATLKGRVTNEAGEPLPFASIFVKGTNTGTSTNEQGYYQLSLASGSYEVVFQYLGYKQQVEQVQVGEQPVTLNVQMQPEVLTLSEVQVRPGNKDPGYYIMQHAIAKRKYFLNQIQAFRTQVYTKGLGRLTDVPPKVLGVKVVDMELGIVYLSETVSEMHYRHPDKMKERMLSSKVSGSDKVFSFNRASRANFNFYENLLKAPGLTERGFVSPLAANANFYYDFELAGTKTEGNLKLNKIKVIPKRKNDPVFSGYLYIVEDQWRLHSLDLTLGENANIEFVDKVHITQNFKQLKDDVWVMHSQKITFYFRGMGFEGNGYFTAVYSKYQVVPAYSTPVAAATPAPETTTQPEPETQTVSESKIAKTPKKQSRQDVPAIEKIAPKKIFNNEVMRVEKDANERDSAYWTEVRPIPLTEEEKLDYVVKDSIQEIKESRPYLDSVDRVSNRFSIGNLYSSGYTYTNSWKKTEWQFDPVIGILQYNSILSYNTVEGVVVDLRSSYRKTYENRRFYEVTPAVRYGFSNQKINAKIKAGYYYNPLKYGSVSVEGGRYVDQIHNQDPIWPFINSLYTLLREKNYMKLYQKDFLRLGHRQELVNGVLLTSYLEYAQRRPLYNTTDFKIKDVDEREFTPNTPVVEELANASFAEHEALTTSFALRLRFAQKYITRPDRKFTLGSKYPTLTLHFRKGWNILGSDLRYSHAALNIAHEQELGLFGTSSFDITGGTFLNRDKLTIIDYRHFAGNRTFWGGNFDGFQLLPYYRYSTRRSYFEGHYEHHFNGFLFNKLPLFRRLGFQAVVSADYLHTRTSKHYAELGLGIEHILKFLRVDFVTAYQSQTSIGTGFRIGLGF
ncbi:MAG: DUF5686 and carboxypeptidase regulatory-like domain-containing protein [Hymenobacteraceae bacterium]|nr:DUF5686 and carboxypeptidase regulatory-like domain-containing protein [Hymenobacteraceae bacterium]MDX5396216.1 DUF5686 and carboxypeptidase regulatory-like domain-containing protein [Hymenobacteraceae bacterium]MDX5512279.1 DUF5686 and carboxypeptidase regulatory-like domain-containing protein [Hymenobacteraceae bacterium]